MEDQVALVTGAGRGIGRAIALELARRGFNLCLAARSREQLEETRRLSGLPPQRSLIVLVDLTTSDGPEMLLRATLDHFGRLDLLVNNAGWAPPRKPIVRCSLEEIDAMVALNLRAPIVLTKLAAKEMMARSGGTIVNIASTAGKLTPHGEAVYAATKAGLLAFTRACFAELRHSGIKIGAVVPGLVDTSFVPANKALDRARMLSAEDVASAVIQIQSAPPSVCPLEIWLEPQYDPMRTNSQR